MFSNKLFARAIASVFGAFAAAALPVAKPLPAFSRATAALRDRTPHHNAKDRKKAGIPHGVSGAKLARKARGGRASLATLR